MSDYLVKPLGPDTWDAFARLAERHNGVWGGCWCTWFHMSRSEKRQTAEGGGRALKQRLVNEGRAHAALVFDGDVAVAGVALRGALELIAQAGGGIVEGYPQDTKGNKVWASFLYNGTRGLFEQAGFSYGRGKGKSHCVMSKAVGHG